jgi:hypothetical protein
MTSGTQRASDSGEGFSNTVQPLVRVHPRPVLRTAMPQRAGMRHVDAFATPPQSNRR